MLDGKNDKERSYRLLRAFTHYFHHLVLLIIPFDMFQVRITSDIMKKSDALWDSLDGRSARYKAFTSTGQCNTQRRGQTPMP
jgi:hypothetical protein